MLTREKQKNLTFLTTGTTRLPDIQLQIVATLAVVGPKMIHRVNIFLKATIIKLAHVKVATITKVAQLKEATIIKVARLKEAMIIKVAHIKEATIIKVVQTRAAIFEQV
jgi:hypothetical protein